MKLVMGESFRDSTVRLGPKEYRNCTFTSCNIIYEGTATKLIGCKFLDCGFQFEGAARHTVGFLHGLWTQGAASVVENTGVGLVGAPLLFGD